MMRLLFERHFQPCESKQKQPWGGVWREGARERQRALYSSERELSFAHSECSMCFNLTFHFALALSKLLFMNHFPACRSLPANTGGPAAYGSTHKRAHVSKCHTAADRWMRGEREKAKEKSRTISQKKWFKNKTKQKKNRNCYLADEDKTPRVQSRGQETQKTQQQTCVLVSK